MDIAWVKIDSWHAIKVNGGEFVTTYCGRTINKLEHDPLNFAAELGNGKSCENCLRIVSRAADVEGAPV